MEINIKTLKGECYLITIDEHKKVYDVKCAIKEITSIPVCDQILIYIGNKLDNNAFICDISLKNGTYIHLIKRDMDKQIPKNSMDIIKELQAKVLMLEDRISKLEDHAIDHATDDPETDGDWLGGEIKSINLQSIIGNNFVTIENKVVYIWSLKTGKIKNRILLNIDIDRLFLILTTSDEKYIIVKDTNHNINIFNSNDGTILKMIMECNDLIIMEIIHDKLVLIYRERVDYYSVDDFTLEKSIKFMRYANVRFKPCVYKNYIIQILDDKIMQVSNKVNNKDELQTYTLRGHFDDWLDKDDNKYLGGVYSLCMTRDDKYVVSGGTDDKAIIWKDGSIKHILKVNGGTYNSFEKIRKANWLVIGSEDSKYVFCSTMDGWIRSYSVETGVYIKGIKLYNNKISKRIFITKKFLISYLDDNLIAIPLSEFLE